MCRIASSLLLWNGTSSVWYFLHQQVKPVKKEFSSSSAAGTSLCFRGCFGSLRNVPVSTLKFVPFKDLQPFVGPLQQRNIPWLWKPHCLFLRAPLASLTCCTSLCLYYLKPEAVGLLGGYGHLPSDCSPHHLVWWCLCRSPGSNNTLLLFWTPIYPKLSSLDPSYFLNSIVFSVWTVLICYI